MEIKSIKFIEDPKKGFDDMVRMAEHWAKTNKDSINIKNGTYTILKKEETSTLKMLPYKRAMIIQYTGVPQYEHPQTCTHDTTRQETIDPMCIDDGVINTICNKCELITEKISIPKLGHDMVYTPDNNSSCLANGTETGICSRCGYQVVKTVTGSALGHDYMYTRNNDETCTEDGTETGVCIRCGETTLHRVVEGSALGHSYPDQWTVRIPATSISTGLDFKRCTRCGHEITRETSMLGYTWVSNRDGTHNCVTVNGIEVENETCSPNGFGDTCDKCGYVAPISTEITTDFINGMIVNDEFSQTLQSNITGTWSIISGTLPPGITLSADGILIGTPTTGGVYTFTVQCASDEQSASKEFSVNIANRMCTVTFDAQGGTASESSRQVAQGSTIGTLPIATKDDQNFGGWYTATTDGLKIDPTYSVNEDITLYARWGESSDIEFGEVTTQFNIQYEGDRTNYQNNPYTLYIRMAGGADGTPSLEMQTGISSTDGTSNMTATNKQIKLYLKVTNTGAAGYFDIGFDADSYVVGQGDDKVQITRIDKGIRFGNTLYEITVNNEHTAWIGRFADRTTNRYVDSAINSTTGANSIDTGFAFTINNVFINSGSYTILEVTFKRP